MESHTIQNAYMEDSMQYAMKRINQQKMLAELPLVVRKKVRALRKLQLGTTNLEAEFHRMVFDLERRFQDKHNEIFNKRRSIVSGDYEPNDDECNYPDPNYSSSFLAQAFDFLNVNQTDAAIKIEDAINSDPLAKGIPNFWLNIFKFVPMFHSMVEETDEPILKHLVDVSVISKPEPDLSFVIEFHFTPNDYFDNDVLTKEYQMKCNPDPEAPFSFDGPEIYKSIGCTIYWKEGKDLTQKKTSGGDSVIKTSTFFTFFNPPDIPEDDNSLFDEINDLLEADFEIGHYLKERIVPRAILYFTGEYDDDSDSDDSTVVDDIGGIGTDDPDTVGDTLA